MNAQLLIDAIVNQTTILIAALATARNTRSQVEHVANDMFSSLVRELKQQKVPTKVLATMFGMALSTYHTRVRQLQESSTDRDRSLWAAVFEWVREQGPVLKAEVLGRFSSDDERLVKAILSDLVDGQLLVRTGRGHRTTYRAATESDRVERGNSQNSERIDNFVWIAVHRFGPISAAGLERFAPAIAGSIEDSLDRLIRQGRILSSNCSGETVYSADQVLIPHDAPAGWEAAVFDHFQAVVSVLCIKLRRGKMHSSRDDLVGGKTLAFDLWEGHPLYDEVVQYWNDIRSRGSELCARVQSYNAEHAIPTGAREQRFLTYMGQAVIEDEEERDS